MVLNSKELAIIAISGDTLPSINKLKPVIEGVKVDGIKIDELRLQMKTKEIKENEIIMLILSNLI